MDATTSTIQTLIKECDKNLIDIYGFKSVIEPQGNLTELLDGVAKRIEELRDKWGIVLESDEKITPEISYSSSYAFVILAGYLKELKFGLEKEKKLEEYLSYIGNIHLVD